MTRIWHPDTVDASALHRLFVAGAGVLLLEVAAVLAYVRATGATDVPAWQYAYPLIWINLTLIAVAVAWRRSPPLSGSLAAIAGTYFLVLAWIGGIVSLGGSGGGLTVHTLPPGWGPMIAYESSLLTLSLVPFRVVGYLGLTYLVYVALGRSLGAGTVGLVGLLSCVTCTGSVLALVVGALGGGSVATMGTVDSAAELSLLVFALSIVALLWVIERPSNQNIVPE
ncbi:DUF7546 family protein [Natranaeroarchaeum aerophilus]|uniref:ABC transporter ATP-binding protein n=1 Tax=Natranaeroarchaeum aerophilus TaxID=2917711 RepID=A0AAE3FP79_9EURY|nr:ABC transporter ATP-binding protein [Natranaeroarchaeum aerophilus]MCL9813077.1 ABC transporter ATP-binding protein [Natranaeroarchaeum aerophilus]